MRSTGNAAFREPSRRTPARRARPRAARGSGRPNPRSRKAGQQQSRWASEPEIPETFGDVQDTPSSGGDLEDAVGPALDRVVARDASAAARRPSGASTVDGARARESGRRARRRPRARSGARRAATTSKARVRGEHRQARRGRLVDDLVGRARAHVVDERVGAARAGRAPRGAAPGRAIVDAVDAAARDEALERLAVAPLLVGQRRPAQLERTPASAATARGYVSSPFAGEVRPSASSAQRPAARLGRTQAKARQVDPVADRDELPRRAAGTSAGRRVSTSSRALGERSSAARRQCVNQSSSGHAQRARERRREHGVDRAHVRDDRGGPWRGRARGASAVSKRSAARRPASRERKRRTRQFSGSTPSTARSASTTSSSTRAASARELRRRWRRARARPGRPAA